MTATRNTRVLFVDDEPLVLRSLDRALRARKVPWDVRFVESGDAALALLATEPFDVVVADLRIPDRDGVEVLTEVQRAYPQIARLVLSGQVGTDDCLRAMRVAHQCMAKPCNIDTLRHVIQRLSWIRGLLDSNELAARATQLSCLPSPPRVHFEVCAAISRGAGLAEIARIIDDDIALTAKLIQIVNSAFFTRGAHVTTVQRALTVLGTDVVRNLLLGVEVFRALETRSGEDQDDREREALGHGVDRVEQLRRHSKLVGQVAQAIAPRELGPEAVVAGMLHDIGELVFANVGLSPADPLDHARAGGFLLGLWGLSEPIVDAIAYHHEPGAIADDRCKLVDALHVAEIVVGELEAERDQRHDAEVISAEWLGRNEPHVLEHTRRVARELWEQTA